MEALRKWGKRLLFPPVWLVLPLAAASADSLAYVFLHGLDGHPAAYVIYALSAYALTVLCAWCAVSVPRWFRQVKERITSTSLGRRYIADMTFRTLASLWLSLGLNSLYVCTNLAAGVLYRSYWSITLAAYYFLLSCLRLLLLWHLLCCQGQENRLAELRLSRRCAAILLALSLTLSGVVTLYIRGGEHFEYPGVLVYAMAAYTFYHVIVTVRNAVKFRKNASPVLLTARLVSFISALVSMLALEAAMLTQFAQEGQSPLYGQTMMGISGGVVCIVIVGLSLGMIIRATGELKRFKINNSET